MVNFIKNQIVALKENNCEAEIINVSDYGDKTGHLCYVVETESGLHRLVGLDEINEIPDTLSF
jgi:hypothetical protein